MVTIGRVLAIETVLEARKLARLLGRRRSNLANSGFYYIDGVYCLCRQTL